MKSPRSIPLLLLPVLPLGAVSSCRDEATRMGKGFRLPAGNIEKGQTAFLEMKCHQCHTVVGVSLPNSDAPSKIALELGGAVRKVKTHGELVTSIIQPQHIVSPENLAKLGEQPVPQMPSFNDRMTVNQLIDIVTFLQSHYQKAPPPGTNYPYYAP